MLRWKLVLLRILQLQLIYFLLRAWFILYNWPVYQNDDALTIGRAFLLGARFDISTIFIINIPFFIFWLLPIERWKVGKIAELITDLVYICWNIFFILMSVADTEYVAFNGRRLTRAMYRIKQDANDQAGQLFVHYWYLALAAFFFVFLMAKTFPRRKGRPHPTNWYLATVGFLVILFSGVLSVRGGLQSKPLSEAHAFVFSNPSLGTLALNSAFTVIHSRSHEVLKPIQWLSDFETSKLIGNYGNKSKAHGVLKGSNVVILIMESFALEYMGAPNNRIGYTPFLDELLSKGVFFKYGFANGRRSIEALPAIMASLPSILPEPFLMSDLQHVKIKGLPQYLKREGYTSLFFHGAKKGSMYFDSFCDRVGTDEYFGLSDYPNRDRDYDGFWGIMDEPFFRFMKETVTNRPAPFLATLFTLSSHQPYFVPKELKGQFPKGTLEIHESIGYTDYSLRKFFEEAKNEPWFNNTLFIITGDHTQKSDDPKYANEIGHYRVPIVLYHPKTRLPQVTGQEIVKHTDIMPTVLDLLGVKSTNYLGQSFFLDNKKFVVNRTAEGFWYLDDKFFIKLNLQDQIKAWHHKDFILAESAAEEEVRPEISRLRAYVQYLNNSILNNTLSDN